MTVVLVMVMIPQGWLMEVVTVNGSGRGDSGSHGSCITGGGGGDGNNGGAGPGNDTTRIVNGWWRRR